MDEYRPTLLGRSLADVLQEMETGGAIEEHESDALFAIFDHVMRSEFAAAEPKSAPKANAPPQAKAPADSVPTPEPVELFTHRSMDVQGTAKSFNRYIEKWTVHTALSATSGESMRLEGVPVDLQMAHVPEVEMLVKVHDIPKPKKKKRR